MKDREFVKTFMVLIVSVVILVSAFVKLAKEILDEFFTIDVSYFEIEYINQLTELIVYIIGTVVFPIGLMLAVMIYLFWKIIVKHGR